MHPSLAPFPAISNSPALDGDKPDVVAVCAELLKLVCTIKQGFDPSEEDLQNATEIAAMAMAKSRQWSEQ